MVNQGKVDCSYIDKLLNLLENPFSTYYSDGYLNSEGMTILSLLANATLHEWPWMKPLFRKVRIKRDYQSIVNLARGIRELCQGHAS
ncbi:MAG: hypothetical protein RXO26_07970 [Caldivirga sp.]|jgi:hypothetical protein|uniref:hypothetical protein n=1 Tax=Caldivirga sp. MU80 TaxID=1650354 RepID=UPI000830A40D|nr:hypothetical protein [Caldivirga sp. MU80]MDT7903460.1 hypothetical protein [Caldivirga sp.]NAZ28751.1 hypothetical protein [Caldivirga sp.]